MLNNEFIVDVGRDILKTILISVLLLVSTNVLSAFIEYFPSEFKQVNFNLFLIIVLSLTIYILIIFIKEKSLIFRLFLICCLMWVLIGGYLYINKYVLYDLKGVSDPYVIVFYPDNAEAGDKIAFERLKENVGREVLFDYKPVNFLYIPIGFSGEVEKSIVGNYLKSDNNVLGYIEIVIDKDQYILKQSLPITMPYKELGFTGLDLENGGHYPHLIGKEENRKKDLESFKFTLGVNKYLYGVSITSYLSASHYGIDAFSLGFSLGYSSKINSDLSRNMISPFNGYFISTKDDLIEDVNLSFLHQISLYKYLMGDWEAPCDVVNKLYKDGGIKQLNKYVSAYSFKEVMSCISSSGEDIYFEVFSLLSDDKKNEYRSALIKKIIKSKKENYQKNYRYFNDKKMYREIININSSCSSAKGSGYLDCVFNVIEDKKSRVSNYPMLWDSLVDMVYSESKDRIFNMILLNKEEDPPYNYAFATSNRLRLIGEARLSCDFDWGYMLLKSLHVKAKYLNTADFVMRILANRIDYIKNKTGCSNLLVGGLNISKLFNDSDNNEKIKALFVRLFGGELKDGNGGIDYDFLKEYMSNGKNDYSIRDLLPALIELPNCDSSKNIFNRVRSNSEYDLLSNALCSIKNHLRNRSPDYDVSKFSIKEDEIEQKLINDFRQYSKKYKDLIVFDIISDYTGVMNGATNTAISKLVSLTQLHRNRYDFELLESKLKIINKKHYELSNNVHVLHYHYLLGLLKKDIKQTILYADKIINKSKFNVNYYKFSKNILSTKGLMKPCKDNSEYIFDVLKYYTIYAEHTSHEISEKYTNSNRETNDIVTYKKEYDSSKEYFPDMGSYIKDINNFIKKIKLKQFDDDVINATGLFYNSVQECGSLEKV